MLLAQLLHTADQHHRIRRIQIRFRHSNRRYRRGDLRHRRSPITHRRRQVHRDGRPQEDAPDRTVLRPGDVDDILLRVIHRHADGYPLLPWDVLRYQQHLHVRYRRQAPSAEPQRRGSGILLPEHNHCMRHRASPRDDARFLSELRRGFLCRSCDVLPGSRNGLDPEGARGDSDGGADPRGEVLHAEQHVPALRPTSSPDRHGVLLLLFRGPRVHRLVFRGDRARRNGHVLLPLGSSRHAPVEDLRGQDLR